MNKRFIVLVAVLVQSFLLVLTACQPAPTKAEVISRVQSTAPRWFTGEVDVHSDNPDAWIAFRWKDGTWRVRGLITRRADSQTWVGDTTWKYSPPNQVELLAAEFRGVVGGEIKTVRYNPNTGEFEEIRQLD